MTSIIHGKYQHEEASFPPATSLSPLRPCPHLPPPIPFVPVQAIATASMCDTYLIIKDMKQAEEIASYILQARLHLEKCCLILRAVPLQTLNSCHPSPGFVCCPRAPSLSFPRLFVPIHILSPVPLIPTHTPLLHLTLPITPIPPSPPPHTQRHTPGRAGTRLFDG